MEEWKTGVCAQGISSVTRRLDALNEIWKFSLPYLLFPQVNIMQHRWVFTGIPFLIIIDKIIISAILRSCTMCLPFMTISAAILLSLTCREAVLCGQLHGDILQCLLMMNICSPLVFHDRSEADLLQWQTETWPIEQFSCSSEKHSALRFLVHETGPVAMQAFQKPFSILWFSKWCFFPHLS